MSIKIHRTHEPSNEKTISNRRSHSPNGIRSKWSVRRFRLGTLAGPASVEFTFPTEGGGLGKIVVQQNELRESKSLLNTILNYLPIFPKDVGPSDAARAGFLNGLVSSHSEPFELVPSKTGFIDIRSFATHGEIIFADGRRQSIPKPNSDQEDPIIDVRGTLEGSRKILKLARLSTYLAFAIGVALAAALPSYLRLRREDAREETGHLTETAVFSFSGPSGAGKSSVNLAVVSLAGSPRRAGTMDFTPRGLAEIANDNNDLPLALEDTENAEFGAAIIVKALKSIAHAIPGGRSKLISRGVDQNRLPPLRWSNFGLCSSPRSIFDLAAENRWDMTMGDKVRLFDIRVPGPKKGGIFDLIDGTAAERAVRSIKLIGRLERAYQNNHGHIIPEWVICLMAKDHAKRIIALVQKFIRHVGADKQGWETRFARIGYIYAAMKLGVESGLLPWPRSFPLQVAARCYRKARKAAKTSSELAVDAAARLRRQLRNKDRVALVPAGRRQGHVMKMTPRCIAIRYVKAGKDMFGVLDSALTKLFGTRKAKAAFTNSLNRAGLIHAGHGHAGTVQERFKIERNGKIIDRLRLWSIEAKSLIRFLKGKRSAGNQ